MRKRLGLFAVFACAALAAQPAKWFGPMEPFHIIGNVYYIGTQDLASFLITTPSGHIIVNGLYNSLVPRLQANTEQLGFNFSDVKLVLGSHAHGDHMEGNWRIKDLTGAQLLVMAEDAAQVKSMAGRGKPQVIDRLLQDGDTVTLGGVTLTALRTPGHTPGCTTWTFTVDGAGTPLNAVILCGMNLNAFDVLVGKQTYPGNAADYQATFDRLRDWPVDVFLAPHGTIFQMLQKHARIGTAAKNPFIDPKGFRYYLDKMERQFHSKLASSQPPAAPASGTIISGKQ
jgi:metallo-beta-lactamase class B